MASMELALDNEADPCLCELYEEIKSMDPTDMIRLTWGGKTVARIIVGA